MQPESPARIMSSNSAIRRAARRFRAALDDPRGTQERLLSRLLRNNSACDFGSCHGFESIGTAEEFARRVPLSSYEDYDPWIERIGNGDPDVLTCGRVERLHLTSGTNGRAKMLPFTAELRTDFFAGIGPWLENLLSNHAEAMSGPSHWVISPACLPQPVQSAVPVGFDQDESYLPASVSSEFAARSAVPAEISRIDDAEKFYKMTAAFLLAERKLSFISMWSPTYLSVLLDAAVRHKEWIVESLHSGSSLDLEGKYFSLKQDRARARELEKCLPDNPLSAAASNWNLVWPRLRLISCWSDGWSKLPADKLAARFPDCRFQGKGLMATEAFVTFPLQESTLDDAAPVLSVCSHYFEFIDCVSEEIFGASELKCGGEYEVVVTTAGGLYRYRIGDIVRCEGHLSKVPRLRFLLRKAILSDLCGEKLDDALVGNCLQRILTGRNLDPELVFLAPLPEAWPPCYGLYISLESGLVPAELAAEIDQALCANFYYDQSRRANQLGPPQIRTIGREGAKRYFEQKRKSQRESTVKWRPLETGAVWEELFFRE